MRIGYFPASIRMGRGSAFVPVTSDAIVAGGAALNGIYTLRGLFDGNPYYNLEGEADQVFFSSIHWDASINTWEIRDGISATIYTGLAEGSHYPWEASFINFTGDIMYDPAPTVIQGL